MIILKSPQEIERMAAASRAVAGALETVARALQPGITTLELDRVAHAYILRQGGVPAFKGYRGFPASICASVNEEVVHGIPGLRRLQEGDIISVDVGAVIDGYYGDAAVTLPVGNITREHKNLIGATREALARGIAQVQVNNRLSDISHAVQTHAEGQGFAVVTEYVGHGIGREMHEEPQIPNFGPPGRGPRLQAGMVLAIEPMVNAGTARVHTREDGWTVVTEDGKASAHFEHTVAVTDQGPRVLTHHAVDEEVALG